MLKSPCSKECKERNPECHISCDKYKEFSEERKKISENRRKENLTFDPLKDKKMKRWKKDK
jgi:hypothetical protein